VVTAVTAVGTEATGNGWTTDAVETSAAETVLSTAVCTEAEPEPEMVSCSEDTFATLWTEVGCGRPNVIDVVLVCPNKGLTGAAEMVGSGTLSNGAIPDFGDNVVAAAVVVVSSAERTI